MMVAMKFLLVFALTTTPDAFELEGATVFPRYVAEFTTQEACADFYWRLIGRDDLVLIFADDKPCGWDAPPSPHKD